MTKDTGGQAFPKTTMLYRKDIENSDFQYLSEESKGMTLRDYFIAHAPDVPHSFAENHRANGLSNLEIIIIWESSYADATIAERSK